MRTYVPDTLPDDASDPELAHRVGFYRQKSGLVEERVRKVQNSELRNLRNDLDFTGKSRKRVERPEIRSRCPNLPAMVSERSGSRGLYGQKSGLLGKRVERPERRSEGPNLPAMVSERSGSRGLYGQKSGLLGKRVERPERRSRCPN